MALFTPEELAEMAAVDAEFERAAARENEWKKAWDRFITAGYGDPAYPEVQLQFWSDMADLQYPGAEAKRTALEERVRRQKEQGQNIKQAYQLSQEERLAEAKKWASAREREINQTDDCSMGALWQPGNPALPYIYCPNCGAKMDGDG